MKACRPISFYGQNKEYCSRFDSCSIQKRTKYSLQPLPTRNLPTFLVIFLPLFTGELLRYILPIYAKFDVRPQITGLVTTNDGTILLIDRANRQIQEFRQDGTFERFIGGNHVLKSPFCVGVAKNGDIVVSDACQIKIFDGRTETVKNTMGRRGIGKGKLLNPRGLTVDIDNNAVVADCESHKIHVLSLQDGENSSFGSLGTDAGFFDTPCDVAVTSDGRKIVVVEARNHRVQVFTRR
jgi:DNA-binding beta-propeller fold protein YncE